MKKAIVVVNFGSTVEKARVELAGVVDKIGSKYSDRDVFEAYSSGFVLRKLKGQGLTVSSLDEVLSALKEQGYQDVFVQPTFIIPGREYEMIRDVVEKWATQFEKIEYGYPLIYNDKDIQRVSSVILDLHEKKADEALVVFGHGTDHICNFIYPALQTAFRVHGEENAFVATLEGWPSLSDVISQMKQKGLTKAYLIPFLLCAGEHVKNDVLGEDEDSWINQLHKHDFEVRYSDKGLSNYSEIIESYRK